MATRVAWILATVLLSIAGLSISNAARAQGFGAGDPFGQSSPLQAPPAGAQPAQPGQPGQPETHAASGSESGAPIPTQAAHLPEDPNAIPDNLKGTLISDYDRAYEQRALETTRKFYGVYYEEQSGDYNLKALTVPPLWMERTQGTAEAKDTSSLYGLSYYRRRSPRVDADVFFPFFWRFRHDKTFTTIFGPWGHRDKPDGHDNWLAPLYFEGTGADGESYLHIPPLLSLHSRSNKGGFSMVGPAFCKWQSGPSCDGRTATKIDLGIAPLYFWGRDNESEYEIIPPLLRYYSYTEKGDASVDIWGPVWTEKSREGGVFNVLPLYWHNWTKNETNTTVLPLFHYGTKGTAHTLVTPLFLHRTGEKGEQTFATYFYARHRGRTELDMYTPLVWDYRDPDIDLERLVVLPFYYRNTSPRSDDIAVFPFYAHFHRYGIYNERWVTPLFRHRTDLTGWETDIFPVFFMGKKNNDTHLVVAPLIWDFASPRARQTVVFPFYWRFTDQKEIHQLVGNTFYYEEKVKGGSDWQFHFFPLFSYGESPTGHWWNVLYGMAGYTRDGTMAKMRVAYIPFTLSE